MQVPTTTPELRGERVLLRAFRPDDVDDRQALGEDPEIIRMFGGSPDRDEWRPMSRSDAQEWVDHAVSNRNPLSWAIEHDGRLIGSALLENLREDDRKASYAVGILDRSLLGRGLGAEVARLVLDLAFDTLGLHRVHLKVLACNERAIRSYTRVGFVREGVEREACWAGGEWHDDVIMAVLASGRASS